MESARSSLPSGLFLPGLALLLLLPFSFPPGARGQTVEVLQAPESVSVAAGKQVTLNCIVTATSGVVIGPVRWFKGSGDTRTFIYSEEKGSFSRISRAQAGSATDFSITVTNITTADTGTYYCVKLQKHVDGDKEYTSRGGVNLSVNARPSAPNLSSPPDRVENGSRVTFTCTSEGFVPQNINVTWLKDGTELRNTGNGHPGINQQIDKRNHSYRVTSNLNVTLRKEDIHSRLTCQITHDTLPRPLNATVNMCSSIRVSPSVKLLVFPASTVQVNVSVKFTCNVERFYPQDLTVKLHWQGKAKENATSTPHETVNDDGTYSVMRSLQFIATEQWNQSLFTCEAQFQGTKITYKSNPQQLTISKHPPEEGGLLTETPPAPRKQNQENLQYYVIAACLVLLLLLVLAVVIFMRTKKKRDKHTANRRSMHSSRPDQAMDTKDITYADLEFQQRRPNGRSAVAQNDHCVYASVQGAAQPQKDNLMYADLDTVRLNQGPRKVAARPAEDSSEYAEVQIRKQ